MSMLIVCHIAAPIVIARGLSAPGSTTETPTATPANVSSNMTDTPTARDAKTAGHEIGANRPLSGMGANSTAIVVQPFFAVDRAASMCGFGRSTFGGRAPEGNAGWRSG